MVQKLLNSKTKYFEIKAYPLSLENILKDWSVDNMKKNGLKGYVHNFSVGCNAIAVADKLNIHKNLVKKNGIV